MKNLEIKTPVFAIPIHRHVIKAIDYVNHELIMSSSWKKTHSNN